jgi:two-component sensor histidine kinase
MSLSPRNLFLLLGLAFALIVIGFRVQLLWLERDHLLEQRQTQAAALARFGASYSARIYDSSSRLAAEIAEYIEQERPAPDALHSYLVARTANTTQNAYAVVLDAKGEVVAVSEGEAARRSFGGPAYAMRVQDAIHRVEPEVKSQITGAVIYPLTQRLTNPDGTFAGVVSVNARPDGIRTTAERRPEDPQLSIWTLNGQFIAAAFVDFDKAGRAIPPPKPAGIGLPGAPTKPDPNVLIAKTAVDGWPLVAVASYDRHGVLQGWRRNVLENIGLVAAVLIGVVLLVWLGVRTAEREETAKQKYLEAQRVAEEALGDRELLLKEIHHRIKNSLILTSSLLYLQARQFKQPDVQLAFEATQRRLSSIGLVHDVLYTGGDLSHIDLAVYLDKLTHDVADALGADSRAVTITIDVEPIILTPDQITPVGLIVSEVLTNAFKHAFAEGERGALLVQGRVVGAEVEILVRDDGAGKAADKGGGEGLGSTLIRTLTQQIGGSSSFSLDNGAEFRLRFPMPID